MNLEKITREQAKQILSGMAVMPGMEEAILESQGYQIEKPKLALVNLRSFYKDEYTWYTLDGMVEDETEHFMVAAGAVTGKYSGRMTGGIGKWKSLYLEFAHKDSIESVVSLELANLPITTSHSTYFNGRNCSIIGANIVHVGEDIIKAQYLNPKDKVMEEFEVNLAQKYNASS